MHSIGKINEGIDSIYFVDIFKKTFTGYKWIAGRWHIINNDTFYNDNGFTFSAQSLTGYNSKDLIIFGIFSDLNIKDISLKIQGDYTQYDAIVYDVGGVLYRIDL